jgi:hypothetical protein
MSAPIIKVGALTTPFTPPDACFTHYVDYVGNDKFTHISAAYGFSCVPWMSMDKQCYPASMTTKSGKYSVVAAYSPGSSCPGGWTPACSGSRTYSGTLSYSDFTTMGVDARAFWSKLVPGETWVGCCPRYISFIFFSYMPLIVQTRLT